MKLLMKQVMLRLSITIAIMNQAFADQAFADQSFAAGRCGSAVRCNGLSDSTCSSTYSCFLDYQCTTTGNVWIGYTTVCGNNCEPTSRCADHFHTASACNAQDSCVWYYEEKEEEVFPVTVLGQCDAIRISQGCEGTNMASMVGLYERVPGSSHDGSPKFIKEDGWEMYYVNSQEQWEVEYIFPRSTYIDDVNPTEVQCWTSGFGSEKEYIWTDVAVECIVGEVHSNSGNSNTGSSSTGSSSVGAPEVYPPGFGECDALRISQGCEDTSMGSIVGLYKPMLGATCDGFPVFVHEDGSLEMHYSSEYDDWEVGSSCSSTCECSSPSKAWFINKDPYEALCSEPSEREYTDISIECIRGLEPSSPSSVSAPEDFVQDNNSSSGTFRPESSSTESSNSASAAPKELGEDNKSSSGTSSSGSFISAPEEYPSEFGTEDSSSSSSLMVSSGAGSHDGHPAMLKGSMLAVVVSAIWITILV